MGYTQQSITIIASTSNHWDERDERDEALWDEFVEKVRRLASEPRYESLNIIV